MSLIKSHRAGDFFYCKKRKPHAIEHEAFKKEKAGCLNTKKGTSGIPKAPLLCMCVSYNAHVGLSSAFFESDKIFVDKMQAKL